MVVSKSFEKMLKSVKFEEKNKNTFTITTFKVVRVKVFFQISHFLPVFLDVFLNYPKSKIQEVPQKWLKSGKFDKI